MANNRFSNLVQLPLHDETCGKYILKMTLEDFKNYFPSPSWEYIPSVDEIWKELPIHETYKQRDRPNFLPDVAKYLLNQVAIVCFYLSIY